MTANQLAYLQYEEAQRSNLAREAETARSNLAREAETLRSNQAQEGLTSRKLDQGDRQLDQKDWEIIRQYVDTLINGVATADKINPFSTDNLQDWATIGLKGIDSATKMIGTAGGLGIDAAGLILNGIGVGSNALTGGIKTGASLVTPFLGK